MKNIVYILILLTNLTFGQTVKLTAPEIERYAKSVNKLRAENKLVKISYPNMSGCGGGVDGYYLNKNLVLIDATYNSELGFSSRKIYIDQDKFLKIIYREYFAEWGKYEEKYPHDKSKYDTTKMTYTDTVYSIILTNSTVFHKKANNKLISNKIDQLLLERLLSCGDQMKFELQEVIKQVDSLMFVEEIPYNCGDFVETNKRNPLTIGCGDELYWNTVKLSRNVMELLIDKLDDSTNTKANVPLFGYNYTVADIAYTVLQELIHKIPTFDLLGVPFDQKGCGYCSYWQHLNTNYSNRQKFKGTVKNWYHKNKDNLVWIENNNFATCDCYGKHPNGGHYELKTNRSQNIQSNIELSEPVDTNQNIRSESNSLTQLISKTATSFHDWYIDISNREYNTVPTSAEVVKNENGKCKLDNEPYFNELRKLGTISEKFINNELARTKECADYLATITWKEYQKSEAYEYSDNCPQFYYMYWTNSQDVYSGVIVDEIEKKDSNWIVKLVFYNDYDTRYFDRTNQPVVTVENEAGKWMITKINWLKNK